MGKKRPQLRKKLPETKKAKTSSSADAAPAKKTRDSKVIPDEEVADSSDDEDDEDEDDDDENDDEINLDKQVELTTEEYTFEFNDMKDAYYLGLRTILNTFISQMSMSSELTELICKQGTVGTVVNNEGEDDVFAFATVLPYATIENLSFSKEIVKSLETAKHSTAYSQSLLKLLQQPSSSTKLGFLFHGRFTNLPIQLIYELHRNLLEDFNWAKQYKKPSSKTTTTSEDDEVDEAEVQQFQQMTSFLFIANASFTENVNTATVKAGDSVLGWNNLLFHNFEDEFYFQEADLAIVGTKHDFLKASSGPEAAATFPIVMQVPVNKLKDIVNSMKDLMP